ncbi:cytochrome b5, partial [Lepidopterella palustris CBS 459.81]
VYDVSRYLDDHPGGIEVLLEVGGTDTTEAFDYVGHSSLAQENLVRYEIGSL